ncbi:MAG: arginase family protein [Pseudobdellovibrio sp.]
MQQRLKKNISFIQADIEIGQKIKGLSRSSDFFYNHCKYIKDALPFNLDHLGKITESILQKNICFFGEADLNKHNFINYKYLSDLCFLGLNKNNLCLSFGGDHSIALSTIEASLRYNPRTLILWIDAHADINSAENSISGNFHGMPVYYLMQPSENKPESLKWMQEVLNPEQIIYLGLRSLDDFESDYLKQKNIKYYTNHDIKKNGLTSCLNEIKKISSDYEKIHLSFDIDAMDTSYPLCTGVPVDNGLKTDEMLQICDFVRSTKKLSHIDVVEINPNLSTSPSDLNLIYFFIIQMLQSLTDDSSISERTLNASTYSKCAPRPKVTSSQSV